MPLKCILCAPYPECLAPRFLLPSPCPASAFFGLHTVSRIQAVPSHRIIGPCELQARVHRKHSMPTDIFSLLRRMMGQFASRSWIPTHQLNPGQFIANEFVSDYIDLVSSFVGQSRTFFRQATCSGILKLNVEGVGYQRYSLLFVKFSTLGRCSSFPYTPLGYDVFERIGTVGSLIPLRASGSTVY